MRRYFEEFVDQGETSMNRLLTTAGCLLGFAAIAAAAEDPSSPSSSITSPDGRIRADVFLDRAGETAAVPHYRVSFRGRDVVMASRLGVDLADGTTLGAGSTIESVETRTFRESYTQFPGKRSRSLDHGTEAVIAMRERAAPSRRWEVVVRAYDDGIAFRYRFPAQEGWSRLEIAGERTAFRLPDGAVAHAAPMASFTTPHEVRYQKRPVAEFPKDWLVGLPLLVELPQTGWAALLEAELVDYAGLYVRRDATKVGSLACRLSPLPAEPKIAVRAALPHESPWRVVMIADKLERFVESDLVQNLNAPCAIGDTSWIKPGKTTFPWWNGFHEENVPFKMGLNTATARYYIDFCAEAGIPYHSLDGLDNVAWYGGPIVPYRGAGITEGIAGLDLREVIRYASSRGVKLRLWMNWRAAEAHMDRAFPLYREWGIEGVMIDFLDRDDQDIVNFVRRLLKTAAANRLTVTIHNTHEPTGLERSYPNLLTTEGVMNLEFDKWDPVGIPPEHELTAVFTRMLAGPMDFHQGSLRGVPVEQYRPRNAAPLVMGTPCRTLASYVVFLNHLPMVADYPSAYRGHPALPVLVKIPVTWDDTRCLSGKVGEAIVIARRKGDEWWVGAMTDRKSREAEVPLAFLGAGRVRAEIDRDDPGAKFRMAQETREVGADDVIRIPMAPAGGLLIHLVPTSRHANGAADPARLRTD
jgi:alpha-glucosidase